VAAVRIALDPPVSTKYILASLAIAFFVAAAHRLTRDGRLTPQTRTWLMIATIFSLVSAWLF
jgi:hypothetical protein